MKKFKSIFLVLVIMLLSLGFTSTTYARERNGSSGRDRNRDYGSRGYRSRRDNSGGWGGPKLNYDGKTSGLGKNLGRLGGGALGDYLGGKAGDSWERRTNRSAHDKWNNKGSKGNGNWRFSDEID